MSSGGMGGWDTFRKSKNGLIVGLIITILASAALMLYAWYICFIYMVIALIMYGVPTYFGLKSKKKLAVFGIVLLFVLGLSWGVVQSNDINSYAGESVSASKYLTNGYVTPVHGAAGGTYVFNVTLADTAPYKNVTMSYVNNWDTSGKVTVTMSTTDNLTYTATAVLATSGIYAFDFSVWDGSATVTTDSGYGPITANSGEVLNAALFSGFLLSFLQIGLLFFMLLVLTWWMDKSKTRMQQQFDEAQAKRAASEDKFVCSECGADVPADADKCPQCGERFDDAKELPKKTSEDVNKCPKCGAAIFDTDKKCWNCGLNLEKKDQK